MGTEKKLKEADMHKAEIETGAGTETGAWNGHGPLGNLSVALVHYPVHDKKGEVVATSITNLDIHDISRCARTYGLHRYFLVHPGRAQQEFAREMLGFWKEGYGKQYNPDRSLASEMVSLADSLDWIDQEYGRQIRIATTARGYEGGNRISFADMGRVLAASSSMSEDEGRQQGGRGVTLSFVLLLGTGWGLTQEVLEQADYVLEPITGAGTYNHLSVRSAASILFDRLFQAAKKTSG